VITSNFVTPFEIKRTRPGVIPDLVTVLSLHGND